MTCRLRRSVAFAVLLAAGLALAGCLLSPGKFASTLDLRRDGRFSFTYAGEIHLLALGKLAQMGRQAPFAQQPCLDEGSFRQRPCTPADLAGQRQQWETRQANSAERRQREAASMKAMLGGLDPTDPRAAEELAQRLRRQAGWRRVDYKGDGLFDVDFALSGQLDHDFAFPTIERFAYANPFVQIAVRADGSVRVDAPGFSPAASGGPWRGMMEMAANGAQKSGARGSTAAGEPASPGLPMPDGTFTLRTDGVILANNTDEGPQADTSGQRLGWTVNPRTPAAPTALIRLRN